MGMASVVSQDRRRRRHHTASSGSRVAPRALLPPVRPVSRGWQQSRPMGRGCVSVIYVNYNYNENSKITRKKLAVNDNYNYNEIIANNYN